MDDRSLADQARLVSTAPLAMLLVDLPSRRAVEASDALLSLAGTRREDLIGEDVTQFLVGGPSAALPLLASGQIDGYEATRALRYPDGRETSAHVWAHSFGDERPPVSAVFVIDEVDGVARPQWSVTSSGATVLGSVDGEWHVERISPDVRVLLGYEPDEVVGTPFLGAVHPGDVADLLTGLGHAGRSGETVILRMRIRMADGNWCWCRVWAAPIGDGSAFAFMLNPADPESVGTDMARQLHERLTRIAHEVNMATELATIRAMPPATHTPALAELTAREWQVVSALRSGTRAADVAQMLNLAPSTVRNHLAAVYRKLGVSSQVELLAALNRSDQPVPPAS